MRIAAVACLGGSEDDLPILLEQAKSRSKDVRKAALKALGRCDADDAARMLCEAIRRDDLALAVEPLRRSPHPAVAKALLDAAEAQFNALVAGKEKDAKKLGPQNARMVLLLDCLEGRQDARAEALLLTMFERVDRLAAIKSTPSGKDVVESLVSVMAEGPPRVRSALIDAHATLPAECLGQAFAAARRSREPAEVFAMFSPYLAAGGDDKKKSRGAAAAKQEQILDQLTRGREWDEEDEDEASPASRDLDPGWLDLAVRLGLTGLVQALAVPGHAAAGEFLAARFRQGLARSGADYELTPILDAMIRVGHPGATDAVIELIQKLARAKSTYGHYYVSYWVGRMIPGLPRAEAIPKLEALLPSLPEKLIDQLLGYVIELKQGAPDAAST